MGRSVLLRSQCGLSSRSSRTCYAGGAPRLAQVSKLPPSFSGISVPLAAYFCARTLTHRRFLLSKVAFLFAGASLLLPAAPFSLTGSSAFLRALSIFHYRLARRLAQVCKLPLSLGSSAPLATNAPGLLLRRLVLLAGRPFFHFGGAVVRNRRILPRGLRSAFKSLQFVTP